VQVTEIRTGETARITLGGVSRVISTALLQDVQVGDFVALYVGCALAKIDPEEAEKTLEMLASARAA
jgi:hydrogenase expression/formation protein HypC